MIISLSQKILQKCHHVNSGYVVFLAMVLSLIGYVSHQAVIVSALLYWYAALARWSSLSTRNSRQALILLSIGLVLSLCAFVLDPSLDLSSILDGNSVIVSMLAAVSFLTVISQPNIDKDESLPQGKRSILSTFAGVHLFGAVINISSLFIHADRMSANRPLTQAQVVVLTRGFSTAALWSPFFAAMAVAFSYAPEAKLLLLITAGASLALLGMLLTFIDVKALAKNSVFHGYPLRLSSLWLPSLLTVIVLATHHFFPELSILFIVTLSSPLLCFLVVAVQKRGIKPLQLHVESRLMNMQNEIILFLSAGIFGFGLKLILGVQDFIPMFETFDGLTASLSFLLIMLLSVLGFHMLIGISVIAPLVLPLNPDPSLFALVILASWSLGAAAGPLSGLNISIQAAYGIESQKILRWNLKYVVIMSVAVVLMLNTVSNLPSLKQMITVFF